MNQRQPSTTTVATPNQLIPVNSIGHPAPQAGPGTQMSYAQHQYATHQMSVGPMTQMTPMGIPGTMPQPGTQAMYYPAPVAGRAGPPQGMAGGMPVVMGPVGAGRGMATSMPINTPGQPGMPTMRYPPQQMGRGMAMPATMGGAGRGVPPNPSMMVMQGMRMQPGAMPPGAMPPVQRVGPSGMHPHPGQGVGPSSMPTQQQVLSYPSSGPMHPQGVMMVTPQQSPIKQPTQLYPQNTGHNPNMGMQNGAPMGPNQLQTSASPVRNPSPSASASAAATPANAATPGQRVANASTPTGRPGTANHPTTTTNYAQHTPRMQHMEPQQNVHPSPGSIQRNTPSNPSSSGLPPQVNPGVFRATPAQIVSEQSYANMPGLSPSRMDGTHYMGQPPPNRLMNVPNLPNTTPQNHPGAPLQPQLTGGAQPLMRQATGGSVHGMNDSAMQGHAGGTSMPPTPSMSAKTPAMNVGGAMQPPSAAGESSAGSEEVKPLTAASFRNLPPELNAITNMSVGSIPTYTGRRQHAFGVLRLLSLSRALAANNDPQNIPGLIYEDYWQKLLSEHFTQDAVLSIRTRTRTLNPFVDLPYSLIIRFFSTLSQANVYRMSFGLDGAAESQEGQEYSIQCSNARWFMHYSNGWTITLFGTLRAKCRLVPMDPYLSSPRPNPTGQPTTSAHNPASGVPNESNSSPAQSKLQSPLNRPLVSSPKPMGMPYMAKLSELVFETAGYSRSLDLEIVGQRPQAPDAMAIDYTDNTIPPEPLLNHGFPAVTMRMIEMVEGTHAIWPILGHADENQSLLGPIDAMADLVRSVSYGVPSGSQNYYSPSLAGVPERYIRADMAGFGGYPGQVTKVAVKREAQVQDMAVPSTSTLTSTGAPGSSEKTAGTSTTSTAPSISPTLAAKATGKKSNTVTGSPTKTNTDKEKSTSKRKNTMDNGEVPSKRRNTRKASKA